MISTRRCLLVICSFFPTFSALAQAPTLYTYPSASTVAPLYALIRSATKTIDMTMYELVDTTFSADLVAACRRGVKVRVILDQNLEKTYNAPAYKQLNAAANCTAAYANPAFQATHQKSFILDGTTVVILTMNLTSRYYKTSRDFALVEHNAADIAAIQATFNADFNSTTDFSYQPPTGTDLIWSPTTATADLLGIINGAKKTLLVENEEMGAANVVSALEAACRRGVAVHIVDDGHRDLWRRVPGAAGCRLWRPHLHQYYHRPLHSCQGHACRLRPSDAEGVSRLYQFFGAFDDREPGTRPLRQRCVRCYIAQ